MLKEKSYFYLDYAKGYYILEGLSRWVIQILFYICVLLYWSFIMYQNLVSTLISILFLFVKKLFRNCLVPKDFYSVCLFLQSFLSGFTYKSQW